MKRAVRRINFPGLTSTYAGKVRDMYFLGNKCAVAVTTDQISAFDVVLPRTIPGKGQVLTEIARHFLLGVKDIVPIWYISSPLPQVMIGHPCISYKVEMIVRGYIGGSMWRAYKNGQREFWGITLPDGMREWQKLPEPLLTPTTKAEEGHDEDISMEEIVALGLATQEELNAICGYSKALFERGTEMAKERGLILVDTKYEFGKTENGSICVIDEIHTPDSSRYLYSKDYEKNFETGLPQRQLSKEFVREWLMSQGFEGKEGQTMPEITDGFVHQISERYKELYEIITGQQLVIYELPESDEALNALFAEKVFPSCITQEVIDA